LNPLFGVVFSGKSIEKKDYRIKKAPIPDELRSRIADLEKNANPDFQQI
jgi:hypothetical protein